MTSNESENGPADAVLEEIHETRRKLLNRHGGIAGLATFLREQEANSDRIIPAPDSPPGEMERTRPNRKHHGKSG